MNQQLTEDLQDFLITLIDNHDEFWSYRLDARQLIRRLKETPTNCTPEEESRLIRSNHELSNRNKELQEENSQLSREVQLEIDRRCQDIQSFKEENCLLEEEIERLKSVCNPDGRDREVLYSDKERITPGKQSVSYEKAMAYSQDMIDTIQKILDILSQAQSDTETETDSLHSTVLKLEGLSET